MEFAEFELGLDRQVFSMQDIYWIVDYKFCKNKNKVVRNIKPTPVYVYDKNVTPAFRYVISTPYYFRQVGRTGNPLSKVIQAFSSYQYDPVHIFTSKEKAEEFYKNQCVEVIADISDAREQVLQKFDLLKRNAQTTLDACP